MSRARPTDRKWGLHGNGVLTFWKSNPPVRCTCRPDSSFFSSFQSFLTSCHEVMGGWRSMACIGNLQNLQRRICRRVTGPPAAVLRWAFSPLSGIHTSATDVAPFGSGVTSLLWESSSSSSRSSIRLHYIEEQRFDLKDTRRTSCMNTSHISGSCSILAHLVGGVAAQIPPCCIHLHPG